MTMSRTVIKNLTTSAGPRKSEMHLRQQSVLFRELEVLLNLTPRTFSSTFLALPKEIMNRILDYVIPNFSKRRPELHTCLWGADMVAGEPWRHDIFSYNSSVLRAHRLSPNLILINKQIREELLQRYYQRSKITLHAELQNKSLQPDQFNFSPHILKLPMLKHITHIKLYIEWNYTTRKDERRERRLKDQVQMASNILKAMNKIIYPLQSIETIELSILFFWNYRSGKIYSLTMQDLFDLEDIFKRYSEQNWLSLLHTNKWTNRNTKSPSEGVAYKMSSENTGTAQSGGMDIFISLDLEDAMNMHRRKSNVDFYGNYGIADPLPQPCYRHGAMI